MFRSLIEQPGSEADRLTRLMAAAWDWVMSNHPESATAVGYPGQNHRWTDLSPEAIEREKQDVRALAEATAAIDAGALQGEDALNHALFSRQVGEWLQGTRFPEEYLQIDPMHGPQATMANIMRMMPTARADQLDDVCARLEALPALIDQILALLERGLAAGISVPRVVLAGIAEAIEMYTSEDANPLMQPLQNASDMSGLPEARGRAAAAIRDRVAPAYRRLHTFFVERYVPGCRETISLQALPDGEEWYAYAVRRYTTTTLTPKEIHEIGRSEVARIRAEMERVIAEVGFEADPGAFAEFLRTDPRFFFSTPEELLRAYRDIAKRADPGLIRLFGKLPRTPYGVMAVPSYMEKKATTAYYELGSPEAGRPGIFYANTYDLASRPSWEMEALTLHEAVPGHHLQIALAQELEGLPDLRRFGDWTAFIEGWGLYAESLGSEMGFYADPYSRFGQLTYEMWRAVRLVVDTGIHAFGWTREEAIAFFERNTSKAHHDIAVEVDRYIAWPGQALAYKIGELKLKELRAHAAASLGDAFDVRAFHDRVLGAGALPLDVLETRIRAWVDAGGG